MLNIGRRSGYSHIERALPATGTSTSMSHPALYTATSQPYAEQIVAHSEADLSRYYENAQNHNPGNSAYGKFFFLIQLFSINLKSLIIKYNFYNFVAAGNTVGNPGAYSNEPKICVLNANGHHDMGLNWWDQSQMLPANYSHMYQANKEAAVSPILDSHYKTSPQYVGTQNDQTQNASEVPRSQTQAYIQQ